MHELAAAAVYIIIGDVLHYWPPAKLSSVGMPLTTCRTKATQLHFSFSKIPTKIHCEFLSLKKVSKKDLCMKEGRIGRGAFGTCYVGSLGPLQVCAKVFRRENVYESVFCSEAVLLSMCSHANLPWLYGIVLSPRIIIQSYHSIDGDACTLHKMLCHSCASDRNLLSEDWKRIILGMASAVQYIHLKEILHNDIKGDNIVLDNRQSGVCSVLIDFGKGCFVSDAKFYKLSTEEKRLYSHEHPQVAPEVRDGHYKQSESSDVYSLGRVLTKVNEKTLKLPGLSSYCTLCTQFDYSKRPTSSELFTVLSNFISL